MLFLEKKVENDTVLNQQNYKVGENIVFIPSIYEVLLILLCYVV